MARIARLENLQQFTAVNLLSDGGYHRGKKVIPNTAEITIVWALADGKFGHNVLHGGYTGAYPGTVANANALKAALAGGAQWTALAAFLHPTCGMFAVTIRDLNSPDNPVFSSNTANVPGTSAGTALPSEVSLVVTLRAAKVGPQNRGRMYVPGWATTALGTTDTAAAGAVSALSTWASTIAGIFTANGNYTFGIGHLQRDAYTGIDGTPHDPRDAGLVPILATEVRDNHWDTIRRRGLK